MRTLRKNKQKMYYALQGATIPVYERDGTGNIKVIIVDGVEVPVETGEYETGYNTPVEFYANISESGGEAEAEIFGLSKADYDAVLVIDSDAVPLAETALIWHESVVLYKDDQNIAPEPKSADYAVKRVSRGLNTTRVLLQRITK